MGLTKIFPSCPKIFLMLRFFVASVEFFNTTAGFNVALASREKRMALRANVYLQFFFRRAGLKSISATASYSGFKILRVNFFLQNISHLPKSNTQCLTKKDFIITTQKYQCVILQNFIGAEIFLRNFKIRQLVKQRF